MDDYGAHGGVHYTKVLHFRYVISSKLYAIIAPVFFYQSCTAKYPNRNTTSRNLHVLNSYYNIQIQNDWCNL